MSPTFAYGKNGKRHAYYVSAPLQRAIKLPTGDIGRLPAEPFEALVLGRLRKLSGRPDADVDVLLPMLLQVDLETHGIRLTLERSALLAGGGQSAISQLQSRLVPGDELLCETRNGALQLIVPMRPVFRGGRTWIVRPNGQAAVEKSAPDRQLLKALAQAHAGLAAHDAAPSMSVEQHRRARSLPDSYIRRLMGLAFLAPDIQRAILAGRQPAGLTGQQLLQTGVPLAWADQRSALGF